jgi:hypothetical protein
MEFKENLLSQPLTLKLDLTLLSQKKIQLKISQALLSLLLLFLSSSPTDTLMVKSLWMVVPYGILTFYQQLIDA